MCNGQKTPWMGKKTFFLKRKKVQGSQVGIKTNKEGWKLGESVKEWKHMKMCFSSKEGIFKLNYHFGFKNPKMDIR